MTVIAGIWRAELYGDVRAWNAKTVIVPVIDDHIGAGRHMTRRASEWWLHCLVPMVLYVRIFLLCVTLQAGVVTG